MKAFICALMGIAGLTVGGQTSPQLLFEQNGPQQSLRIFWASGVIGFGLEESKSLGPGAFWEGVTTTPSEQNGQFSVLINAAGGNRFFRLRSLDLTGIADSSPLNGETGVAVTRETIVRFTRPLSKSTVLTGTNFYAGFGGRRLLTRIELSSDRTRGSLFYLEPMPGSTRVTVVFDGTGLYDESDRPLDMDGDGVPGGFATIQFDTLNLTGLTGTSVIGRVFASELMPGPDTGTNAVNRPLEGVTITVDGNEQELRTTTDAHGNFILSPAPPGRFFVKIDGRTAKGSQWPNGAYYPSVGKAWEAVAGKTNNFAGGTGEIFLPLIPAGTLQAVSQTEETTISFPTNVVQNNPALAGVFVTVPPNSLFNDNGTRGGKVGIAPVPPDRLPGPLPPGADLPLVITVQTDGALNFDTPAPACFPNLPNSVTGKPWPAGTKGSLISFNHKKGVWEDVGGMTVSADGKYFCTDPGVGIRQPGWHGPQCPKPKDPPPPNPPPPDPCTPDPIAIMDCFSICREAAEKCRLLADLINNQLNFICDQYRPTQGNEYADKCLAIQAKTLKARLDACTQSELECDNSCTECFGTPRPESPLRLGADSLVRSLSTADGSSISEQILADLNSIYMLIAPLVDSPPPFSPSVEKQVEDLLAHANSIAGGDSVHFLEDHAITLERSASASPQKKSSLSRGNAPAYPVLYAAEIQRGTGTIVFRGATEPFGQYLVFVPPDGTLVSVSFYDPHSKGYARIIPNVRPEAPYALPHFTLHTLPTNAPDTDHDGLPDVVELVYGTDPTNADTDGDGIPDGAEVDAGTDPLGGFVVQTGIIATAKTPGSPVDVSAANDLVVTAEGTAGISIFNAYRGENPVIVAHVPTPGDARRVAVAGNFVAVAQPDFGISIIDVSAPASAAIVQQFPLSGVQAVVIGGETAYVGGAGVIAAIDLSTGFFNPLRVTNTVRDVALQGHYLYALFDDQIITVSEANGKLSLAGSAPSPFFVKPNERLFVAEGIAYAVHNGGYNTFDLAVPSAPALIKAAAVTPGTLYGWKQLVSNGSGAGLAAVGPNSAFDFAQDVSLYDLSSPTNVNVPITIFPTPGSAQSVAIWKGLGYVADLEAGLQVINYLPYDSRRIAPSIRIVPGFDTNGVPAGSDTFLRAIATDDVQVRAVEFYLDDKLVFTDGSFPFEYRFAAPALTPSKTNFTLRARAVDTGGNATSSETIIATLVPDPAATALPGVKFTTPAGGGGRTITNLAAYFSKPLDPSTLNSSSFQLFSAGADGIVGTADDLLIPGGRASYRSFGHAAVLTLSGPLKIGRYRAVISTGVADLDGRHLADSYAWEFQVADATFWVNFSDGAWDIASNWDTGHVPTASESVIINLPVTVTLRNKITIGQSITGAPGSRLYVPYFTDATLDGVTLNTDLLLDPNVAVRVTNGLAVNATITMPGGPNYTQLLFYGTQRLEGSGEIVLGDINYKTTRLEPVGGTLTIGPNLTVRGSGVVGDASLPLVNLGNLLADNSAPGASLTVAGATVENRGTLRSRDGALIEVQNLRNLGVLDAPHAVANLTGVINTPDLGAISGAGGLVSILGLFDNRNHILTLDTAAVPWQLAGGTILGGSVKATGPALKVNPAGGTLDGVILDCDADLMPGANLRVTNGLTVNGVVTLGGAPNPTQLRLDGTQTLDGRGAIVLQDINYRTTGIRPLSGTLTIGASLTVRGSGVVGDPTLSLLNLGTIIADVGEPGASLTVTGAPAENRGTLRSTNGATLFLENLRNGSVLNAVGGFVNLAGHMKSSDLGTVTGVSGTVTFAGILDNQDSTLTFDTTGVSWLLSGARIVGGTIKTTAGQFGVTGPKSTFDHVTVDADFYLNPGANVIVTNGLTLNSVATLAGSPDYTRLLFDGTQTFDGPGQVVLQDIGYNTTQIAPISGALTLGPTLKIRGSGVVGDPSLPLLNVGTISSDNATPGVSLTVTGSPFENRAAVNSKAGAVLNLENLQNHGAVDLSSAILNLIGTEKGSEIGTISAASSTVNVLGILDNRNNNLALDPTQGSWHLAGTILGGTIGAPSGTGLTVSGNRSTLDGVTLNIDLAIDFGVNLRITNGLTLNRTATLESGFNFVQTLNFDGPQNFDGTGTVLFAGIFTGAIKPLNGALTVGAGLTIRGGSGTVGDSALPLTSRATIIADGPNAIIHLLGNPFTNLGSNTALNGGKIVLGP